jgi:hypothetical protein
MIERKSWPAIQPNRPRGPLCLRIVGTARDSQLIHLSSRKCTIGSAPGCTLRLRAQGVRSLECLIVRGKGGTLLRASSPDVRVNGQAIEDTLLSPGDRLGVGPIELEVVALDADEVRVVRAEDETCVGGERTATCPDAAPTR